MGLRKVILTTTGPASSKYDVLVGVITTEVWFAIVMFGVVASPKSMYGVPSTRTRAYQPLTYNSSMGYCL